jgi:hypothetical protein
MKHCRDCVTEFGVVASGGKVFFPPAHHRPRPVVEESGGRCATHWRNEKKRRKGSAHEKRVQKVYGLAAGDYDRLYEFQGGRCAICQVATGATKKLAVDHDHHSGEARGLLCSVCNKLLGHLRDDLDAVLRIYIYLKNPPAARLNIRAIHEENRNE